jgi:hypothetical protein
MICYLYILCLYSVFMFNSSIAGKILGNSWSVCTIARLLGLYLWVAGTILAVEACGHSYRMENTPIEGR